MSEFDYRLLIALLLIVFGSAMIGFARKLKNKLFKPSAPVFKTIFSTANTDDITYTDQMLIIPEQVFKQVKKVYSDIQTIPEIERGNKQAFFEQLEQEFYAQQENKAFANAAVKTFKAWHSGIVLNVFDPEHQLKKKERKELIPTASKPGFQNFVFYRFLGIQNADLMPKTMKRLQEQYAVFFETYTLKENEFLLAWGQYCILTNQTVILFSQDHPIQIEHIIPVPELEDVQIEVTGMEKLR